MALRCFLQNSDKSFGIIKNNNHRDLVDDLATVSDGRETHHMFCLILVQVFKLKTSFCITSQNQAVGLMIMKKKVGHWPSSKLGKCKNSNASGQLHM